MSSLIPVPANRSRAAARFDAVTVTATLLLALPAIASAQHVNPSLWTTNGAVGAPALVANTLHIGGDFDYVGPYTGNGVPLGAATGATVPALPKLHGRLYTAVGAGTAGCFL